MSLSNSPAEINVNANTSTEVLHNGANNQIMSDGDFVMPAHPRAGPSQGEDDFKKYLTHPVLLSHVTWGAAGFADTIITNDLIAFYFATAPTPLKNKLENLYFVSGVFRLRIVVQGAAQAAGQMAICAYPTPKFDRNQVFNTARPFTKCNRRIVPHCIVDPSKSETYEIDLPVVSPTGYYPVTKNGLQTYGSYILERSVFTSLISGTATTPTVSVCIYGSFVDPTFSGLRQAVGLGPQDEVTPSGTLSSVLRGASHIGRAIGSIMPSMEPTATVFSAIAGGFGDVLQRYGYSKPQAIVNQHMILNRTGDNYSQVDGISTALVMGRSQAQTVSINPEWIAGQTDDMNLDKIVAIPGYFNRFTISPTQLHSVALYGGYVDPCNHETVVGAINPTPLSGVAMTHSYWKGDITFTFEFIASVFHRCTVLIAWDPSATSAYPGLPTAPPLATALTALQNTSVYVCGNTTVDVTFPYQQPLVASSVVTSAIAVADPSFKCTNGAVFVYVLNPLISNGSTDPITCNLFIRSDNISFALPTTQGVPERTNAYSATPPSGMLLEAEALGPLTDTGEVKQISFGKKTDLSTWGFEAFGDVSKSVKDLVSRMREELDIPQNSTNANTLALPTGPRLPYETENENRTFLNWYLPAFLGSRGSYRISVGFNGPNAVDLNHTIYATVVVNTNREAPSWFDDIPPIDERIGEYAFTTWNPRISPTLDVIVPMITPLDFYPSRNYGNFGDLLNRAAPVLLIHDLFATDPDRPRPFIFRVGAGDDWTVGWFLGFPQVQYL